MLESIKNILNRSTVFARKSLILFDLNCLKIAAIRKNIKPHRLVQIFLLLDPDHKEIGVSTLF